MVFFDSLEEYQLSSWKNNDQLILVIVMYCVLFEVKTELNFGLQQVNDISTVQ
jgi:hypothetical protein